MKKTHTGFQYVEKGVYRLIFRFLISTVYYWFDCFQIDVAQVVSPKILETDSNISEIIVIETIVHILNSLVKFTQDPLVDKQQIIVFKLSAVLEISRDTHQAKLCALPYL